MHKYYLSLNSVYKMDTSIAKGFSFDSSKRFNCTIIPHGSVFLVFNLRIRYGPNQEKEAELDKDIDRDSRFLKARHSYLR